MLHMYINSSLVSNCKGWYLLGSRSAAAMQALCLESDSHSAIYTIFVLNTINAVVNLKHILYSSFV